LTKFKKPLKTKAPEKELPYKETQELIAGLTDEEYNTFYKLIPTARKS
jgi:hypothetical protein